MIHPKYLKRVLETPLGKLSKLLRNFQVTVDHMPYERGYMISVRGVGNDNQTLAAGIRMPEQEVQYYITQGDDAFERHLAERVGSMIVRAVLS